MTNDCSRGLEPQFPLKIIFLRSGVVSCTLNMASTAARASFRIFYARIQNQSFAKRLFSSSGIKSERYFTRSHEWVDVNNETGTVGITDHAQAALGELVYVELPEVGDEVEVDDPVGTVESVKAASEVITPVSGEITEVNDVLSDNPSFLNTNAENEGWLFRITLKTPEELNGLMSEDGYASFLAETENQ